MLDFLMVSTRSAKNGLTEIYPRFKITTSSDLMIRGGDFYAIYNENTHLWSTSEQDAIKMIDAELAKFTDENKDKLGGSVRTLYMWDADSGSIDRWHKYVQKQLRDSFHPLDDKLVFANTAIKKEDYASKSLAYPLEKGTYEAWDKIVGTLYSESERKKIEWAIGAIVTGESKYLQKFLVLYGAMGTGKSTVLNVIQQLFEGYYAVFDAKALGSSSNQFALESFRTNPLVAIQHDGDLSRIEDNTRLNSLVSHETMTVNEKYAKTYANAFRSFLFLGTNKPVKITDSRSGLLRRLIDVEPTGNKIPVREYRHLVKQIPFELGAIAYHCKEVYESDPSYYDDYIPVRMLGATNDFFNFLTDAFPVFKKEDGTTLKAAWEMYKTWCDDAKVSYPYPMRIFKEELKDYFKEFEERIDDEDDGRIRNTYKGFKVEKFKGKLDGLKTTEKKSKSESWLVFNATTSVLDSQCANCVAQYANEIEAPARKWENARSKLKELDTKQLHYVRLPENHIVIDFDLKDETGKKCLEKNIEAASKWPKTYAELSKSGAGIHLHYIYTGDVSKINPNYAENIEVKVFVGLSSLRRKLTKCNDLPIASISSGIPLKGEKAMVNVSTVQSEKGLRAFIQKNLNKEIHADTASSINFIAKKLDEAYNSDLHYDVSDMYNAVMAFAANSTNQADRCIKLVGKMQFKSKDASESSVNENRPRVFFDCESFPNLFLINWKFAEEDIHSFAEYKERLKAGKLRSVTRMINPTPSEIEELLKYRLIGFNNLSYDNLMVYASYIGYTPKQNNQLSDNIIKNNVRGLFKEAKTISESDVYDFASAGNKKSLKKLEVEMGIPHQELGLRWDQPVPEELWPKVAEYCDNDVISTEAAFWYLEADWIARQILSDLADLTTNDSTNALTTKIIFGNERKPQSQFCYRNLAEPVKELPKGVSDFLTDACPDMMAWWSVNSDSLLPYFPGYKFEKGKSTYLGEEVGEGGRVYAEPGMHSWVALLDIASMHPHSTIAECLFGPEFTKRFKEIVDGRVSIKHEAWDVVNTMLGGKLSKYIKWVEDGIITSKQLANALKTAINSVYGLTAAKFDNPFKDPRNIDNIVAKRGALFMMNLEHEVKQLGFTVAHIKTDSIKIPMADKAIIDFVMSYGKIYGYTFEHEATYERMCLVNDAVYVARYAAPEECEKLYGYVPDDNKKKGGQWTATGKQFQVPYVFKTLFTNEPIEFEDMCEVLTVKTALVLREGEDGVPEFVGRVGRFCPIKAGCGGKVLLRESTDAEGNVKYSAATGTKGYYWLESETVKELGKEADIDRSYYDDMVNKAVETMSQFGDFESFRDVKMVPTYSIPVSEPKSLDDTLFDNTTPCKSKEYNSCSECPKFTWSDYPYEPICAGNFDVSDQVPF